MSNKLHLSHIFGLLTSGKTSTNKYTPHGGFSHQHFTKSIYNCKTQNNMPDKGFSFFSKTLIWSPKTTLACSLQTASLQALKQNLARDLECLEALRQEWIALYHQKAKTVYFPWEYKAFCLQLVLPKKLSHSTAPVHFAVQTISEFLNYCQKLNYFLFSNGMSKGMMQIS